MKPIIEGSGLAALIKLTKGRIPTSQPTATSLAARKQSHNTSLRKSHFDPVLHPFLDLSPWTKVNTMMRGKEFLSVLHRLQLHGQVKDSFLAGGGVFDFHGITLESFVTAMAKRGGTVSVLIGPDHVDRITIGVKIPNGNRSIGWAFTFEAHQQGFGWFLELSSFGSGIGPKENSPESPPATIQNRLLPGG